MNLLKDYNFVIIEIIYKVLAFLKNPLNYVKNNIFERFLKSIIEFFWKKYHFKKKIFITYNNEKFKSSRRNIVKNIRNLFSFKKEQNDTAIIDMRNLFRLKKEIKGTKDIVFRDIKNNMNNLE